MKILDVLLDILFPKKCLGCSKEGLYICKDCEIFLSEVENGSASSPQVTSVWEYEGLMEKLIYKIKFDGCFHIIDELAEKALEKVALNLPKDAVITYVPMYKKREKQRGFNQAELIAKNIGRITNKKVMPLLAKTKDNRSQVGLNPQEREENVRGVFRITPDVSSSTSGVAPNVLLVDDVYTTGATARECIKTLKKAGARNVWAFTLARKLNL